MKIIFDFIRYKRESRENFTYNINLSTYVYMHTYKQKTLNFLEFIRPPLCTSQFDSGKNLKIFVLSLLTIKAQYFFKLQFKITFDDKQSRNIILVKFLVNKNLNVLKTFIKFYFSDCLELLISEKSCNITEKFHVFFSYNFKM